MKPVTAEKKPAEALAKAETELSSAKASIAKWQAETINVERHVELEKLNELEDEFKGLETIVAEAKAIHDAAVSALENARKALAAVPAKIKEREQVLAQRQAAMNAETQNLEKTKAEASEKEGFLQEVNGLAAATKAKSTADVKNAELAAATTKLAETIALLQKDFANAQADITTQQAALKVAQDAIGQAKVELEETKKLTQTAPKIVEEKQATSKVTQGKFAKASESRNAFKAKVDGQKAKADALLNKYLDTLPK